MRVTDALHMFSTLEAYRGQQSDEYNVSREKICYYMAVAWYLFAR